MFNLNNRCSARREDNVPGLAQKLQVPEETREWPTGRPCLTFREGLGKAMTVNQSQAYSSILSLQIPRERGPLLAQAGRLPGGLAFLQGSR